MLIGERITLRAFRPDELEMLRGWFADPARVAGPQQQVDLSALGDQIAESLSDNAEPTGEEGRFAIELTAEQKVIGMIRYYTVPLLEGMVANYEIGYLIADLAERRKGYAREACILLLDYLFDTFDIRRVGASTLGANEPSARLLESLGFIHEGAIRKAVFVAGEWADYFWYGLLREEWAALHNAG